MQHRELEQAKANEKDQEKETAKPRIGIKDSYKTLGSASKKKLIFSLLRIILIAAIPVGMWFLWSLMRESDYQGGDAPPQEISVEFHGDKMVFEWETSVPATGYVKYGIVKDEINQVGYDENGMIDVLKHRVEVSKPGEQIYYEIYSNGAVYQDDGEPYTYSR